MKLFKDIVAGLWSALCIGVTVLWEWGVERWNKATDTQKSLVLCVAIIVVTLGVVSVVNAENAPTSNFGGFAAEDRSVVYMCYMSTEEVKVGTIYTCLVMQPLGPGILAASGAVTFCTITSYKDGAPWVDCGKYDDMAKVSGGI